MSKQIKIYDLIPFLKKGNVMGLILDIGNVVIITRILLLLMLILKSGV